MAFLRNPGSISLEPKSVKPAIGIDTNRGRDAIVVACIATFVFATSIMPFQGMWLFLRWPALLFLAVYSALTTRRDLILPGGPAGVALIAFALTSTLWSVSPVETALKAIGFGLLLLTCGLAASLYDPRAISERYVHVVAMLHVAAIFSSLAQGLVAPEQAGLGVQGTHFSGFFGNSNNLGVIVALTAPAFWCWSRTRTRARPAYVAVIFIGVVVVVLSHGRSALLALLVSGILWTLFSRPGGTARGIKITYALTVATLLLVLFGQLATIVNWTNIALVHKGAQRGPLASAARVEAVEDLWGQFLDAPLAGIGFGATSFGGVKIGDVAAGVGIETSNSYLAILAQLGVVGGLLSLLMLCATSWNALRAVPLRSTDALRPWTVAVALVFVEGVVIAMFEGFLAAPGSLEALFVWSAAAVLAAMSRASRPRPKLPENRLAPASQAQ